MKSTITGLAIVVVLAGLAALAYTPPTDYVEVGDTILTHAGKELDDDQPKTIMVAERDEEGELTGRDVEEFNSLYHVHRNARSRVWLKNGNVLRILAEVNGVVDTVNPLVTVRGNCKITERQPVYVRVRLEKPTTNIPTASAMEIE